MTLVLLLAAAYGSPGMSFPWWVWLFAVFASSERGVSVVVREAKKP